MAYTTHRGKRVSPSHAAMLRAYEAQHGPVYINQGARTLGEQAAFYAHYLRYGSPLAARPWGGAPHIKWGRQNHALDINAPEPAHSVAAFYRNHGVPVAFNVRGEAWHMDTLDEAKLIAAAKRLSGGHRTLREGMKGQDVKEAKKLLRAWGLKGFLINNTYFGPGTRKAVKRLQSHHGLRPDGTIGPKTWKLLWRKR